MQSLDLIYNCQNVIPRC